MEVLFMTHHIFFHADMDGIFSAALVLNKLCEKDEDYRLYPLTSNMRGEAFNSIISQIDSNSNNNTIYVLDFQHHDNADIWIDHHPNYMFGGEPIFNEKIYYDFKSLSTFSLVFKYINDYTNSIEAEEQENIASIAQFIDMVDSARFPSVDFVFENNSPGMLIYAFLETIFSSKMTMSRVVEVLASRNMDLDKTAFVLGIPSDKTEYMKRKALTIKKYIEIYEDSKISLVRQSKNFSYPRYSENYLYPHVRYNIRITPDMSRDYAYIQLSYNSWIDEPNKINIGGFLKKNTKVKGGGHFNAGGGSINYNDIDSFMDDLSRAIHKSLGGDMEKYSVDKKEDPVENKAGLIKEAKDKETSSDDREKAESEIKKKEGSVEK
jgi:oligoribonuclease NrnB/cAMP/cGMP phosphodiesterase (DHH superfamily)